MPADPDIGQLSLDEAIKSVLMAEAQYCLPPVDVKQMIFYAMAACHPEKLSQKQIQVATEWALQVRAQARLIEHIYAKRMTIFPHEDGTVTFGGRLLKLDEAAAKVAKKEAESKAAPTPESKPPS